MAFHLISSNKVELLKDQLAKVLKDKPLGSPLRKETILIPSMPMKRWLGLQLADTTGINCNTDFPLPATWVWQQASAGGEDPLSKERSAWLIFDMLESLRLNDAFKTIRAYLEDDAEDIKRWQLSERIADVFDRYQYYRPEIIRNWSKGEGDDWQSILWRSLLVKIGSPHRVEMIRQFLEQLNSATTRTLPERISIFSVSSLPPLLLEVIQHVSKHIDVYFYYLSPTDGYWADLKSGKIMAKNELENPDEAIYYDSGHELLTSWGKQGQSFQDLLLSIEVDEEYDIYDRCWSETILAKLQQSIFETQNDAGETTDPDGSLSVHICHSPLRECQVLHDALLQALQDDPELKPEDILVMVPEISRYAPYIEAVFAKDLQARPFIPWNLSDISIADEHPVIRTFLQLLKLPTSRFTLSELESLLDVPEICICFAFTNDDVAEIRALLNKLNVRWGVDAEHRSALGLSANIENSWKQAEQRLLAGYAMDDASLWNGIAPVDIDAGGIELMARFWTLFDCLNRWRIALQKSRCAQDWLSILTCMLDEMFAECGDEGKRLQEIRNVLADLTEQAGKSELSLPLVSKWLEEQLAQRPAVSHYFSGGVSFCGMQPMRSLPFRYICLLGMQDAAFPGREHPLEFDCMVEQPRVCDPRKGEADRYLMLETLLCARDMLYISYTGRSIRDNSECQPSVLVAELLDELQLVYGETCLKFITHIHPLQPFSAINFEQHQAYDKYWCSLANAIREDKTATEGAESSWPSRPLTKNDTLQDIDLSRLIQFAKDPVKFFVNRILKIYLNEEGELCDDEPFSLDGLERWQIKDRLVHDFLLRDGIDEQYIKAEGVLPHGSAADMELSKQLEAVEPLLEAILPYQSLQVSTKAIGIISGDDESIMVRITGQVAGYYPGQGLLRVSVSSLSGKNILPIWIEHLALCVTEQLPHGEQSRYIYADKGEKKEISFDRIEKADASLYLNAYVAACIQGMRRPLPVFTKASWAYADTAKRTADKSADNIIDKAKAINAARKAWADSWNDSGDVYNDYVQLMMRGVDENPIEDPEFKVWATRFYLPMQENWSQS